MATLQRIRNRAGLLIGALGVALLAFVLGDFLNSGGTLFNKLQDRAFVVDGDVVSTGEYMDRVEEFENFQKMMSGQNSLDEVVSGEIKEFVYEQMVKEKILDAQAAELGLAVSKEELNDMVYGENISPVLMQLPIFSDPQTGLFSRDALMQFLSFIHTDITTLPTEHQLQHQQFSSMWYLIERMMKYHRLEVKYNSLLFSSIMANDIEAKNTIEDSKYNSNIAYVLNRYSLLPDSVVTVSDEEVKKLYNERKNNFKQNINQSKISFFVKDIQPSQEDFAAIETEMENIRERFYTTTNPALLVADYSEKSYSDIFVAQSALLPAERAFVETASIGDVYGPEKENDLYRLYKLIDKTLAPDSVKLRIISIPLNDEVVANTIADSLISVINGGKDFSDVANEINPQSNGGEIEKATETMLMGAGARTDFIRSCFTASKGELLKLKTQGIIQLVKVDYLSRPVSKVKLATIQMSVPVSDKTLMAIDSELDQFVANDESHQDFNKAAAEKGYNLIPEMSVVSSMIDLNQMKGSRQIISWAFNDEVGALKKFDLPDQRVVAKIVEKISAGYQPLNEVSFLLKEELIKDKKAELIIADLKAKNLASLDAYAQALDTRVDTVRFVNFSTTSVSGLGREFVLNIASKHAELNKLEGPVKGNAGVLVYSVYDRQESPVNQEIALIKENLSLSYTYRMDPRDLFKVLKEKLNVIDNRVKFF